MPNLGGKRPAIPPVSVSTGVARVVAATTAGRFTFFDEWDANLDATIAAGRRNWWDSWPYGRRSSKFRTGMPAKALIIRAAAVAVHPGKGCVSSSVEEYMPIRS